MKQLASKGSDPLIKKIALSRDEKMNGEIIFVGILAFIIFPLGIRIVRPTRRGLVDRHQ